MQHTLRKSQLNVSYADPKGGKSQRHSSPFNPPNYSGYQQHYGQYPPFGQPSYPGHPPQANPGAYAYYNYGNGQQQGQNNYNQARSYHTQGPVFCFTHTHTDIHLYTCTHGSICLLSDRCL